HGAGPRRVRIGDRDRPPGPDARVLDLQRADPRARPGARLVNGVGVLEAKPNVRARPRSRGGARRPIEAVIWYLVLVTMAVITVFPFAWILLTSLKGPKDILFTIP